ncbi:hypothetical protein ACHWQZ_G003011 [Mnemiopsis leidyi]
MDGVAIIQYIMSTSLHQEIHRITDTEEHAREFLFQRGILKATMPCPGCSSPMTLVACSSSKSSDLLVWRCPPCKRFKNIRSDSVLSGQKLSFSLFLLLVFYLSIKSLPSVAIRQLIGVSENTISDWKTILHTRVANYLIANPSPILPPPALSESSAGPIRRRRHTTKKNDLESEIHEEYGRVLLAVNNGSSIKKSLPNLSIGRTSWYNWRYVAEMKLVDVNHYLHLKEQFTTSGGLCNACKGCLIDGLFMAKAEEMRREKKLLSLV